MRQIQKTLLFAMAFMIPALSGCGGGGGGGGGGTGSTVVSLSAAPEDVSSGGRCGGASPLPANLQATWNETEQCSALSAPPPNVVFSPTVTCPRNGLDECLSTVPFFPCGDNPSQSCGAIGRFLPSCNAIELPDRYSGGAAHEMIHYLLHTAGHPDWTQHSGPEWVCQ